ncbi:MAG TPA: siroheme synthase CysG [Candidatus Binataceae bacterium]|nr:siroheme synthase CysG [Candidatus Binataceae bacterium]
MDWLPAFIRLRGHRCLVVGGGTVALRKARQLLAAGASVTVVAPAPVPGFSDQTAAGGIEILRGRFAPELVRGCRLVIAATDDPEINREVAAAAEQHGVLVNVVDAPALCGYIAPAIIDRDGVTVAIGTDGVAPILARELRARIDAAIPHGLGRLTALVARWRATVQRYLPAGAVRRRFWEDVVRGPIAGAAVSGDHDGAARLMGRALERACAGDLKPQGEVYLVGAGPGDPELLTLAALRLMNDCDVVLHDSLVAPEILAMVRRDAVRIDVGKRCGARGMSQNELNRLMVEKARAGQRVLRLKGGDPFVFGRAGEEMEALAQAGIAYRVVPGITAAAGCAAEARIPLTHRDYAHTCVLTTGHTCEGSPDWARLAAAGQTIVFYMSFKNLETTCAELIRHGLEAATPAAVVSRGTMSDSRLLIGTVETLAQMVEQQRPASPAIVIIGEVVRVRERLDQFAVQAAGLTRAEVTNGREGPFRWVELPPIPVNP